MQRFQEARHALGSQALLTIVVDEKVEDKAAIFLRLWETVSAFENKFSRFLENSELAHFNEAAGKQVTVSDEFRSMLITVREMSKDSEGLFNPFILPALQRAGYRGSWPEVHDAQQSLVYDKRHTQDINELEIGDSWARIPKDSALDFGGIGKGYLLDTLATLLPKTIEGYWLSLGGDILCAGRDINNEAWKISVQDAHNPKNTVGEIVNHAQGRQAIATSGITKRRGVENGKAWHHLIDPRTSSSSLTEISTATVVTNKAVTADVFAKSLVILGPLKAKQFIERHSISAALLQLKESVEGKDAILRFGDIQYGH